MTSSSTSDTLGSSFSTLTRNHSIEVFPDYLIYFQAYWCPWQPVNIHGQPRRDRWEERLYFSLKKRGNKLEKKRNNLFGSVKPHGFYQKVSICIGMGMVRISVETTVIIYFTPTICFVVKSLSGIWFFAIPWTAACQDSLSSTTSQSLLKLMFTESVMPSNHLILGCPLLFLTSICPSIRVFSNELVLHIRWRKY